MAGATLAGAEPWREKSGDGLSLATRPPRRRARARRIHPRDRRARDGGEELICRGAPRRPRRARCAADARVARPLRQVHDLRDLLPGLQRHAAVPGPEVLRAAGGALPHRGRAVRRLVRELLLRLRHLHAGLPAGRPHRRDQHAGQGGLRRDARRAAARPHPRAAHARGPPRHARRAARQLDAAQPAAAARGRAHDRPPPPRADAEVRGTDVPALGAPAHAERRRLAASPSSTAAGRTTTSRGSAR